jgi:hypothetical protein
MKLHSFSKQSLVICCLLLLLVAACSPTAEATIPTSTPIAAPITVGTELPSLTAIPSDERATESPVASAEPTVMVAFVKDGNIHLWNEATNQIQTIVSSGDVIAVTMSDDGEVIVFLRRSVVELSELEWFEQAALWVVNRNGENPREIISADSLRQRLNAGQRDSTNIPYMEWLPGTHRLLFSGWKYIVQAEGESHATPEGLYLVDIDTLTDTPLISAGNYLRFVPSPDGRQIAVMSLTGLSFMSVDGSNVRSDALTYLQIGRAAPLFPTGVWTRDSRSFVITGSFEEDPRSNINFTIWRVPADGSSPEALAAVTGSDPRSVTFSPDGQRAAFLQTTEEQPPTIAGWSVTPLAAGLGPLAIPDDIAIGNASLHWSPAGDPFTGNIKKLCPDATRDSEICDDRIHFDGTVASIQWIDGNRILFLTNYPSVLFLGTMDFSDNRDGTTIPIVAWPVEEWVSPKHFATAASTVR